MKPKSYITYADHIPYPILQNNSTYSLPTEYLPIRTAFKEKGCPSKSSKERVSRYHLNKNRINNSIFLSTLECIACGKDRGLFRSRKNVPVDKIKWLEEVYSSDYQY